MIIETRTYQLSIFYGLKEVIFCYIYLFLASCCTDWSIFHLMSSTQREKDLSEVAYETWKESTCFGISPERNTVLMTGTRLWNNFLKDRSEENKRKYSKQRNYCVSLLRKTKSEYFGNLNEKKKSVITKHFGKPLSPFYRIK